MAHSENIKPLSDGYYFTVNRDIAVALGIDKAIVLSHIHYWIETNRVSQNENAFRSGRYWTFCSMEKWHEQIPYWSLRKLKQIFMELRKDGILISDNFNKASANRTLWYSIDYDKLESMKTNASIVQDLHNGIVQDLHNDSAGFAQSRINNNINKKNKEKIQMDHFCGNDRRSCSFPLPGQVTDYGYLHHQVDLALLNAGSIVNEINKDDIWRTVGYFYCKYQECFKKPHVMLRQETMNEVVNRLLEGTDLVTDTSFTTYKEMIDQYFESNLDCDYHITHFSSWDVMNYRWYECGMGGAIAYV